MGDFPRSLPFNLGIFDAVRNLYNVGRFAIGGPHQGPLEVDEVGPFRAGQFVRDSLGFLGRQAAGGFARSAGAAAGRTFERETERLFFEDLLTAFAKRPVRVQHRTFIRRAIKFPAKPRRRKVRRMARHGRRMSRSRKGKRKATRKRVVRRRTRFGKRRKAFRGRPVHRKRGSNTATVSKLRRALAHLMGRK